uniref:Uncharacterized protein n=1 Tax=Strigamia maritima TaxID=126957 RepID=T1J714_STRMM
MDEMEFERGIWPAALNGDFDQTEKTLLRGVDPNIKDQFGYTPLHYSARNGHLNICNLLLSKGADPNAKTKAGGATPLLRAAFCGHIEVVRCLLKSGANPLIVDDDCKSSLHKAAENKQMEIFDLLSSHETGSRLKEIRDIKGKKAEDYL